MAARKTNPDFTNGVPELLVLRLLSREPMHGYALVAKIKAATGEALKFGEGSIYPILHRLEADGKLLTTEHEAGGRTRLVYRVTKKGLAQLEESMSEWERIVTAVRMALDGNSA